MARLGMKDKSEFVLEPTANFAHRLGSSVCDAASSKRPTCGSKIVVKVYQHIYAADLIYKSFTCWASEGPAHSATHNRAGTAQTDTIRVGKRRLS
jgi:hypothetical protein